MVYAFIPFLIFVAFAVLFPFIMLPLIKRTMAVRRTAARELAERMGFSYREGWDLLRRELDGDYSAKTVDMLQKMPGFVKNMLESLAPWRLEGERNGVRVVVYQETRSSGKNTTTYLVCKAYYAAPLPFKLRGTKEGAMAKIGKAVFNLKDVEIGNRDFDDAVRVVSDDPNAAAELFFKKERAEALPALLARYPAAWAQQDSAVWERRGTKLDQAEIEAVADALAAFAATI